MIALVLSLALCSCGDIRLDQVLAPCVRVRIGAGGGSGTVISTTGLVLTAAHVVAGVVPDGDVVLVDLFAYDEHGRLTGVFTVDACVVAFSEEDDLALLQLHNAGSTVPARILPEEYPLQVFQKTIAMGCPLMRPPRPTRGEVSYLSQPLFGSTSDLFLGNSGGGLMVRVGGQWYLAGVARSIEKFADIQRITYLAHYMSPEVIRRFLQENDRWPI